MSQRSCLFQGEITVQDRQYQVPGPETRLVTCRLPGLIPCEDRIGYATDNGRKRHQVCGRAYGIKPEKGS